MKMMVRQAQVNTKTINREPNRERKKGWNAGDWVKRHTGKEVGSSISLPWSPEAVLNTGYLLDAHMQVKSSYLQSHLWPWMIPAGNK